MTATTPPIDLLREACATGDFPSNASLSDDGKFLTIFGSTFDATTPQAMALGGDGDRVVNYTLASVYLQLINPALLRYHKACGSAGVRDPVKTLDRDHVISHFRLGNNNVAAAAAAAATGGSSGGVDDVDGAARGEEEEDDDMDVASDDEDVVAAAVARPSRASKDGRRSTRDRDDDGGSSGKRRRVGGSSSSSKKSSRLEKSSRGSREEEGRGSRRSSGEGGGGKTKAPSVPITNEQLVANLGKIVDKRHTAPTTPANEGVDGDVAAAAAYSDADGDAVAESAPATPAPTTIAPDDDGPERTAGGGGVDRELLLAWLSPDGFRVDSPTVASAIEADREAVRRITASEIPVGDSASVLRAGAGGEVFGGVGAGGETTTSTVPIPARGGAAGGGGGGGVKKRDFTRVLEIYQEVAATEERARRLAVASSSSKGGKGRPLPPPPPSNDGKASSSSAATAGGGTSTKMSVAGNPIIVVPNAMTSVITMINAGIFLGKDGVYLSREQAMSDPGAGKRGGTVTITRKLAPRLGGSEITYEIIDNPATRLKKDEWNRVVAVICQGASWQFKGWRYSDPVDLFSRTFGFYVGLDGAAVPNELQGWNVKIGRVSRDRRGLDNVCLASFWNGLEEFIAVHKQDFINS